MENSSTIQRDLEKSPLLNPPGAHIIFTILTYVLIAIMVFFIGFILIVGVSEVRGDSMNDTLRNNDRLLTWQHSRRTRVDDIVIIYVGGETERHFVKRVVAVEGDTIRFMRSGEFIEGGREIVFLERKLKGENSFTRLYEYRDGIIPEHMLRCPNHLLSGWPANFAWNQEITVPAGHFYALGDHRNISADSRNPRFGPFAVENLRGRKFHRLARRGVAEWFLGLIYR